MEKMCKVCLQVKAVHEDYFHKNEGMKDGFLNTCKECTKKYNESRREERRAVKRKWDEKNKEHIRKYKERTKDPEKAKLYFAKYYENNKEYFREKASKYKKENSEKLSEYNRKYGREYHYANREEILKKKKDYYQKNKHKAAEARQRRASREYKVPHTLTPEEWEETLRFFDFKDAYTGKEMSVISQDHVIPVSKGGGYTKQNIIPCEKNVNTSKGNRNMEEWYKSQDYFSETRLLKIYEFMGAVEGDFQISFFD